MTDKSRLSTPHSLAFLTGCFRSRASLQFENAMLRHQLTVRRRPAEPPFRVPPTPHG